MKGDSMKNIRSGVFETNSSSSHSVTVDMSADVLETLTPSTSIIIPSIDFSNYDEGVEIKDAVTKASYAALAALEDTDSGLADMVRRVIEKQTGFSVILPSADFYGHVGNYNSAENTAKMFESDESLRMFIFNPKSTLLLEELQ
jgi:hypothetical protein